MRYNTHTLIWFGIYMAVYKVINYMYSMYIVIVIVYVNKPSVYSIYKHVLLYDTIILLQCNH